ncbi:MAG: HupE/UreJ family protein [Massilia sp.]
MSSHTLLPGRVVAALLLALVTTSASAHPGHGDAGLLAGLSHPFGIDHLLAIVAVSFWSITLPGKQKWWGPTAFMAGLTGGALIGFGAAAFPYLEQAIAVSVVLIGALLLIPRSRFSTSTGLVLVALAGVVHGLGHGAEAPQGSLPSYAAGFLLTTGLLHVGAVLIGMRLHGHVAGTGAAIRRLLRH